MTTTKVLPFDHEAFVNPFELVSANDSALFQEPSLFGPAYLKKIEATDLQKKISSLHRTSTLWKVAMGVSIVATAAFLPLSVWALSYLYFSFSIQNLVCTTLCILGVLQGIKSIPFCAQKGPQCAGRINYITKILELKKQLKEDASLLQKKCREFGIDLTLFGSHKEAAYTLLAELLYKENLVEENTKEYQALQSEIQISEAAFKKCDALQKMGILKGFEAISSASTDIENLLALTKVKGAALLAFMQNPHTFPKAYFFSSKMIQSCFIIDSASKGAEKPTTIIVDDVIPKKISTLAVHFA